MLPSKNARTTKPTRAKSPDTTPGSQGARDTTDLAWLQRTVGDVRTAPPDSVLRLQRQYGNRAVNRLLDSVQRKADSSTAPAATPLSPPTISKISLGSGFAIQRELSDEAFNKKLKEYGFRNFPKELVSSLLLIINMVIKKYPKYEEALVENLDSALMDVNERMSIQTNIPGFLRKLAEILGDNGLETFEPPEGVYEIGKSKPNENKKEEYIPEEELDPDELAARKGLPQELGTGSDGWIPLDKRPTANLTMGQGLVANLGQIILHSDEFSTCSPIVMFNANDHQGGLFHFPAGGLAKQAGNLENMYQRAKPTVIYINERKEAMSNLPSEDAVNLTQFFTKKLGFTGKIVQITLMSEAYSVTAAEDKTNPIIAHDIPSEGPELSVYHDYTGKGRKNVEQAWKGAPRATKFGRDDWHS